jgi:hypothetical protein
MLRHHAAKHHFIAFFGVSTSVFSLIVSSELSIDWHQKSTRSKSAPCPPASWVHNVYPQVQQVQQSFKAYANEHENPCSTIPILWSNCSQSELYIVVQALAIYHAPHSDSEFHIMRHHAGASLFYVGIQGCGWSFLDLFYTLMKAGSVGICYRGLLGDPFQPLDSNSIIHGLMRAALLHMDIRSPQTWGMLEELDARFPMLGIGHATGHGVAYRSLGILPRHGVHSCLTPLQHHTKNISRFNLAKGETMCRMSDDLRPECLDGLYMTYWQMQLRRSKYTDWRDPCANSAASLKACLYRLYVWHGGPGYGTQPDPKNCIHFLHIEALRLRCMSFFTISFFLGFAREFQAKRQPPYLSHPPRHNPEAIDAWCGQFDGFPTETGALNRNRSKWCRMTIVHIRPPSSYGCIMSPDGSYHFIRTRTPRSPCRVSMHLHDTSGGAYVSG